MDFKKDELVTASEVARYIYCKRAWWYDRRIRVRQRERRILGLVSPVQLGIGVVVAILLVVALLWGLT